MSSDPFSLLQTPAPAFPAETAARLLGEHYGIDADLEPLSSERDQNFLVTSAEGTKHVLKFANASEAAAITDFQNRALEHIATVDPAFPVPRVVSSAKTGRAMTEVTAASGETHRVRLLSWLDGTPLQYVDDADSIATQSGRCLAQLDRLFASYSHDASDYALAWDLRQAAKLSQLTPYIADPGLREICQSRVDYFTSAIEPRLEGCRSQVIYNDLNPSNILVDTSDSGRLTGVIDFGDIIYSRLVNDVAIAAAYLCSTGDDPFADIPDFLAAYTQDYPLTAGEIELLPDLVLTRHLTTVMITHWRAAMYPDNREYILRNEPRARGMLNAVANISVDETVQRFMDASQVTREPAE